MDKITNQEIIRRVAVEVMGWTEKESNWSRYFDGDPVSGTSWYYFDGEERKMRVVDFNPLTNYNHTMMLVERIAEKYDIELSWYKWKDKIEKTVEINLREDDPRYPKGGCRESGDERIACVEHESMGHAICLVALKAVEEGK